MKKLTKEHAQELKDLLFTTNGVDDGFVRDGEVYYKYKALDARINDHTEKPFPKFSICHDKTCKFNVQLASEKEWGKNVVKMDCTSNSEFDDDCEKFFSFTEFKELAEEFNNAAKWIEDEEFGDLLS